MADYRSLDVWQQGRTIVTTAYRFTEMLPEAEKTGLSQQIKSSALAIPAAIADGAGRGNDVQFLRLIQDALGALAGLDTLVMLAADLEYVEEFHTHDLEKRTRELAIKLRALAGKLESDAFGVRRQQFDRPQSDRPQRSFDRDGGGEGGGDDRPRRPYDRDGGDDRPPRRDDGPPRGDRPYRNDGPPRGDRPPYRNDGPPRGDRPYRNDGPPRGDRPRPPYRSDGPPPGGDRPRPPYRPGGGSDRPYGGGGRPPRRDDGPPRGGGGGGSRPPRRKF